MDLFRMFGVPQGGMGGAFGGGFGMPGAAMPQGPFRETYRCYPVVMMANKQNLEAGDKIILPTSALDTLARLRVTYPMSFSLVNPRNRESKTHCGVMEFSAEEGTCYIPYWMMQNLLIESGGLIEVTNVSLRKGNFVKFQPHSNKFTQLHNPRVVLERALRNFSCLTKGGTIVIQHGSENFYLDVKELRPDNAVSIIETDMNVDFEAAKDAPADTRPSAGAGASSSAAAKDDVSFFVPTSTNPVAPAGVTAAERDFSSGGWGSGGADEVATTADTTASSSGGLPKSTSSDYFSKLGGGNKLREANKRKVSSSATSGVSSASPSPSPSPSLGPSGSLSASNSFNSLSSLRAAGSATPVGGASASTPQSRPTSALANRTGGYSLTGSSSSSKPPAGPTAASTASRPSTASSTPSLSSSSSQSSLALNAAKTVVERQGNWDYYYELLPNNQKKLVRRLPAKDKPAAAPAAAASSSSSSPAPVSGLAAMGPGHRLK